MTKWDKLFGLEHPEAYGKIEEPTDNTKRLYTTDIPDITVDLLFAICRPDDGFEPIRDFKFNRDRLEQLDEMRHSVVHDKIEANPLPNGDDDIWFMMSNANYLMALINMRFDLKLDVMTFAKGFGMIA